MSSYFESQPKSDVVKIELASDDDEPNISDIPDDFLLGDWKDVPFSKKVTLSVSSHENSGIEYGFSEAPVILSNEVKEELLDEPMEQNSVRGRSNHKSESTESLITISPRMCVDSELNKAERTKILKDALNYVDEFPPWEPFLYLPPKPGNIYFCRGSIAERGKYHGSDGLSWAGTGRTMKKPDNIVQSFYYVASPCLKKMNFLQKQIYLADPNNIKSKLFSTKISYRKVMSYHSKANFYMIEYSGDDKALPWLPRKLDFRGSPKKPKKVQVQSRPKKKGKKFQTRLQFKDPKLSIQPQVIVERTAVSLEVSKAPVDPTPEFNKAQVFKTVDPKVNLSDQKEINDMLSRNPNGPLVNDATIYRIVNPRAGEIYLVNMSQLPSWSGIFHCDAHHWEMDNILNWKDYGHVTYEFVLIKHGKKLDTFRKAIHYNALTKMKLIQYYGRNDGVPRTEKLTTLPKLDASKNHQNLWGQQIKVETDPTENTVGFKRQRII